MVKTSLRRTNYKDFIWRLYSRAADWDTFSNQARINARVSGPINSLENPHGSIHLAVGGMPDDGLDASGHMTPPTVSSFDPIFWLHHCAVDRFLVTSYFKV